MGTAPSKCCSTDAVSPDNPTAANDVALPVLDDLEPACNETDPEDIVALELKTSFSMGTYATVAVQLKKTLTRALEHARESEANQKEAVDEFSQPGPNVAEKEEVEEQNPETPPEQPGVATTAAIVNVKETKKESPTSQESPSSSALSNGSLTLNEVMMVEKSWMNVEALGVETVGVLLFKNIFSIEPECLQKFSFRNEPGMMNSAKLKQHVTKVVQTVGLAVASLRNLSALMPVLEELALKHVGYGIVPASNPQHKHYYGVVGHALLKTLRQGLSRNFTKPLAVAWAKVFTLLADTMITASREKPNSAA